jgi:hypothetical protein
MRDLTDLSKPPLFAQVRCLVDVPGEKLPEDLPGYLRATVAHQLPDELRPAFLTALEAEPIRSMQNKQLTSQPLHQPGTSTAGSSSGVGAVWLHCCVACPTPRERHSNEHVALAQCACESAHYLGCSRCPYPGAPLT